MKQRVTIKIMASIVAVVMFALVPGECAGAAQKPTAKKTSFSESELRALAKAVPDVKNAGQLYSVALATSNDADRQQAYLKASAAGLIACGKTDIYKKHIKGKLQNVAEFEDGLKDDCEQCSGNGAKDQRCLTCRGNGKCPSCKGTGQIMTTVSLSFDKQSKPCGKCNESGRCPKCDGEGSTMEKCFACAGTGKVFSKSVAARVFRNSCNAIADGVGIVAPQNKTKNNSEVSVKPEVAGKAVGSKEGQSDVTKSQTTRRRRRESGERNIPKQDGGDDVSTDAKSKLAKNGGQIQSALHLTAGMTKTITLPGGATMDLVYCPPGEFMMGSPTNEEGREDNEIQHRVVLTKGFWIGKYEVTQKQWESVMGTNPSSVKGENRPVEGVSWSACQDFCRKAGQGLGLPTEAQWEYACRAGSTTAYFWGNALNGDRANCNGSYPCGTKRKGKYAKSTCEVGSYSPNAWGIYDMHGNVWEWCHDWYGNYSGENVVDPSGPAFGDRRVCRGGGWPVEAYKCRSAAHYGFHPGISGHSQGFRVFCSDDSVKISSVAPALHLTAGMTKTITLPGGATMDLVYCPPGEFMMGSPANEEGRKADETQHRVVLTGGFWIGKYEVTQEQWKSVMGTNPSKFRGDRNPVEKVSWKDCQEFCRKVGGGLRLPTEAEWEYACRAGSTNAFAGTGRLEDMGWSGGVHHEAVGKKQPNAWGIYAMHGNVSEWCSDCYGKYRDGVDTDPIGFISLSGDAHRVQRGGGYALQARICRSASRWPSIPNGDSFDWEGFRVACREDSPILDPGFKNVSDSSRNTGVEVNSSEYRSSRRFVREHIKKNGNCRVCAITKAGGDIVVCRDNNWASSGCPRRITDELQKISDSGQRIIDVSLTENGRFIVLYGENAASWNIIPPQMKEALRTYNDNGEELCSATMNDAGEWILVSSEHIACSNTWLKKWVDDGQDMYGRLRAAVVTADAAVAVFDGGFKFLGNVPPDLKEALKEADFDVRIVKIAGKAWFFANADGSRYCANM